MSTHVVGFRPEDEQWRKMKAVYTASKDAGIDPPVEVERFFEGEDPSGLPGKEISIKDAVTDWSDEYRSGMVVDVEKLPKDCRFIRFYNSW